MDLQEILKLVEEIIRFDLSHANKVREAEILDWNTKMNTGEGHIDIVREKKPQLSEDELSDIMGNYNALTPYIRNPIISLFEKMYRADGIRKEVSGSENQVTALEESLVNFHAGRNVDAYLQENFIRWQFKDPNAWLMVEQTVKRNEETVTDVKPYPFLVGSENVRSYAYGEDGMPQWVLFEFVRTEVILDVERMDKTEGEQVSDFFFYTAGKTVTFSEYVRETPEDVTKGGQLIDVVSFDTLGGRTERQFVIEYFETGSTEFPGIKVGTYSDPESTYEVKVSPDHPAKNVLTDIILHKAEEDVQQHRHVFPKLVAYEHECRICEGTGKDREGHKCGICRGRGHDSPHRSSVDYIGVKWPRGAEPSQVPDLDKFFYYVDVPIESINYYGDKLREDLGRYQIALFGIVTQEKPNPVAPKTATEITAEWSAINNVIYFAAQRYSELWKKIYAISAQYLGIEVDLVHTFPTDLKLEDTDKLIERLKVLKDTDAAYVLQWGVMCDILSKQMQDTPEKVAIVKAWEMHRPFAGLPSDMVAMTLTERDREDRDRILYENFQLIMNEVQFADPEFHKMKYEAQRSLIDVKVDELRGRITYKAEVSLEMVNPFDESSNEGEDDV